LARSAARSRCAGRSPRPGARRSPPRAPRRAGRDAGRPRAPASGQCRALADALLVRNRPPAAEPVRRHLPAAAAPPGCQRLSILCRTAERCTASCLDGMETKLPSENLMKVLLVGDYPPPYGGVSVHVEVVHQAVRARRGICEVLDVGKGQLPADGVVPATGYFSCAAHLVRYTLRGYRIHVHTSGANRKSWLLASVCAAAGKLSPRPPIITFHSGLGPEWLGADPMRAKIACAVANSFGNALAVSDDIRGTLLACGVSGERIEVLPAFSRSFLHPGAPPHGLREIRAEASPLYCAMLAPGPVYGQETLLRAFGRIHAHNPQARLVVYGPGTELLGAEAARICGEAAASAVHAFGEVHRPSALALIATSDVFVRPTLADGDSVSVREAVALGR